MAQVPVEVVDVHDRRVGADLAAAAPQHQDPVADAELDPGVLRVAFGVGDVARTLELERGEQPARGGGGSGGTQHETETADTRPRATVRAPGQVAGEPLRSHADHGEV